jgi:hypothetical protein
MDIKRHGMALSRDIYGLKHRLGIFGPARSALQLTLEAIAPPAMSCHFRSATRW